MRVVDAAVGRGRLGGRGAGKRPLDRQSQESGLADDRESLRRSFGGFRPRTSSICPGTPGRKPPTSTRFAARFSCRRSMPRIAAVRRPRSTTSSTPAISPGESTCRRTSSGSRPRRRSPPPTARRKGSKAVAPPKRLAPSAHTRWGDHRPDLSLGARVPRRVPRISCPGKLVRVARGDELKQQATRAFSSSRTFPKPCEQPGFDGGGWRSLRPFGHARGDRRPGKHGRRSPLLSPPQRRRRRNASPGHDLLLPERRHPLAGPPGALPPGRRRAGGTRRPGGDHRRRLAGEKRRRPGGHGRRRRLRLEELRQHDPSRRHLRTLHQLRRRDGAPGRARRRCPNSFATARPAPAARSPNPTPSRTSFPAQ